MKRFAEKFQPEISKLGKFKKLNSSFTHHHFIKSVCCGSLKDVQNRKPILHIAGKPHPAYSGDRLPAGIGEAGQNMVFPLAIDQ